MPKSEQQENKISFKPITLTEFGDQLINEKVDRETEIFLCCRIGKHNCGGNLHAKKNSDTHFIIHCDVCNLQLYIPTNIQSFGELRAHFHQFNSPPN